MLFVRQVDEVNMKPATFGFIGALGNTRSLPYLTVAEAIQGCISPLPGRTQWATMDNGRRRPTSRPTLLVFWEAPSLAALARR